MSHDASTTALSLFGPQYHCYQEQILYLFGQCSAAVAELLLSHAPTLTHYDTDAAVEPPIVVLHQMYTFR